MEPQFLRYMLSTLLPVFVLGIGWLVLKKVKKWEASREQENTPKYIKNENHSS
jgi:hypothetical protein